MFDRLVHADWSLDPRKRWAAVGTRADGGWRVDAPAPVGDLDAFNDAAFAAAGSGQRVLLGFDFPIGVPTAYGARTGCADFPQWLDALGTGAWAHVFDVARKPADIAIARPFYPASSHGGGLRRADLVAGLGVDGFHDLLRVCERRTEHRQAGCCLFWTLGGNQVGKAAITGWREVVRPARRRGARLWPFDGPLAELARQPGVVLAETYPAGAYRMVGAGFTRTESKRRQGDRAAKAPAIMRWAARHGVAIAADAAAAMEAGFGPTAAGEDAFDALLGLLKMIEVADGRQDARTECPASTVAWEGWILGR